MREGEVMTTEPTDYDKAKAFLEEQSKGYEDDFKPSPLVDGAYYSPTDKWEDNVDKKLKMLQLEVTVSGVGALVAVAGVLLLGRLLVKVLNTQQQIVQVLQQSGMVPTPPATSDQTPSDTAASSGEQTVPATAPPSSNVKYAQPEKQIVDAPPIDPALLDDLKRTMGEDIGGNAHPQ
jgi:hypothetical protein